MTARTDILDQPERLRGAFWGSVVLHAGMVGAFVAATIIQPFGPKIEQWGDKDGGRFGSVAVNAVNTIPLPNRGVVPNPVANDTDSQGPQAPAKKKAEPKAKAPDPDAIPLKSKNTKQRPTPQAAVPNKWAEQQQYKSNQLYSSSGQVASSPLYQMTGGGGVGFGTNSPFGTQFGWYANLLRQKIATAWRTADVNPRLQTAPPVTIQFTLRRDGSLAPGLPRIVQTSGDASLDRSAQRAILDAVPFPALPPQFDRNEANIELTFQLRR
jgi:TonB family protein